MVASLLGLPSVPSAFRRYFNGTVAILKQCTAKSDFVCGIYQLSIFGKTTIPARSSAICQTGLGYWGWVIWGKRIYGHWEPLSIQNQGKFNWSFKTLTCYHELIYRRRR